MAEYTDNTNEILNNYYIIENDMVKMIIYSKKHGYKEILIDHDDLDRVKPFRWTLREDHKTFYVRAKIKKENGKFLHFTLHRFILNYTGDDVIDHIDRNGLNNMKNNLRIVTQSENMRNKSMNSSPNTVFTNVTYRERNNRKYFCVYWTDLNNNSHTKTFSVTKYGYEKALLLAKHESIKQRKKNNYIVLETILVLRKKK